MFSDNLKKYRTEKGLSQNDIAEKLYVSRQCVSKWEKGVTQPDLQTLTQISEILDVSVDTLLKENHGENKKTPSTGNSYLLIVNILTAVFSSISIVVLFRFMPQTIPAHWSFGTIDRYGSRYEILINLITLIVFLITDILIFFVLKRVRDKKPVYFAHGIIAVIQIAYLIFIIALYAEYLNNKLSFITCLSADLILCVSAAAHPKINKQNYLLGVRTKETLNSEIVWNKTNALASYMLALISLAIIAVNMSLIFEYAYLCLFAYLLVIPVVVLYSKSISKNAD